MHDPLSQFLTTCDVEQFYQVYDTRNSSFEARPYFHKMCEAYDRDTTLNMFSICPVQIDIQQAETTQIIDWLRFKEGVTPSLMNEYELSLWISMLVELSGDKIDQLKFVREWNEVKFEEVKTFYYCQFAFYLVYTCSQYQLLLELQEDKRTWTW